MITKEKKERALGEHLHLKGQRCQSPKCALVRRPYRPGMHGQRRRPLSDIGRQLKEKQKVKLSYGLDERNLRRLFEEAQRKSGSTTERLLELIEQRLDNVVFRLGLGASRSQARQLISHGHILVNQKKITQPGFIVKPRDVIQIRAESKPGKTFTDLKESLKNFEPPAWLALDKEKLEGRVLSLPRDLEHTFEIGLLVESLNK